MNTGDTVQAMVNGTLVQLMLDDRVLPDRTAGQYDSGWWAFEPEPGTLYETQDCFVSVSGLVYVDDGTGRATKEAGYILKPLRETSATR